MTLSLQRGRHSSPRLRDVNGEEKRKVENFFMWHRLQPVGFSLCKDEPS